MSFIQVLKELASELSPVFAHIFQQSIDTGEIPKEWSPANIKNGVPCKMLEHNKCSNIMTRLNEHI